MRDALLEFVVRQDKFTCNNLQLKNKRIHTTCNEFTGRRSALLSCPVAFPLIPKRKPNGYLAISRWWVEQLSMGTGGIFLYHPVGFLPLRRPVFAGAAATLVNQFRYMIKLCRMPR